MSSVPLGPRTATAIAITSLVGIAAFAWPVVAASGSTAASAGAGTTWLFVLLVPLVLAVVLADAAEGGMDAKAIALLGVLSAVVVALRPLGAGAAGIEPIWVVLILAGRALGPGFGFCLGAVSMFASALVSGGVGPWLPYQMLAAAWVGLGAGLLPRARGWRELLMLSAYAVFACIAFGLLMNLWFWPLTSGMPGPLAFTPGVEPAEQFASWLRFSAVTSLGFDIPRAVLAVALVWIAGVPVLAALRRAARRAQFLPAFKPLDGQAHEPQQETGRMSQ